MLGLDNSGQLGDGGSNTNTKAPSSTAINLGSGRTAVALSAGTYHTCAILDNGDLKCWGLDAYGQLGDGGSNTNQGSPVAVSGSNTWDNTTIASTGSSSGSSSSSSFAYANDKVSLGSLQSCGILGNADMTCWGGDSFGMLGDGGSNTDTTAPSSTAINLGSGRTAVAVTAGNQHTCAILDNGDLKCWGYDGYGQLGDGGTNTDQPSPVAVSGSNTWDSSTGLSSGSGGMTNVTGATCTVSPALPTGLSIDSSTCTISGTPTVATSNTTYTVTAVMSGVTYQTDVWFSTSYFELTPSVEGADLSVDVPMTNITFQYNASAASVSGGGSGSGSGSGSSSSSAFAYANDKVSTAGAQTCAILDNGDLKCWGWDNFGQLGDGGSNTDTNAPSSTAINLGTGRTAVAVSVGGAHTCALLDNGDLKCWGFDQFGQLGDG